MDKFLSHLLLVLFRRTSVTLPRVPVVTLPGGVNDVWPLYGSGQRVTGETESACQCPNTSRNRPMAR